MFTSEILRVLAFVPDYLLRQAYYFIKYKRFGSFKNPKRFSEHIQHRMLYERTDQIATVCDKQRMKDFARSTCPKLNIPETLWFGEDIESVNFELLPERWVLKPNHRSQLVIFGDKQTRMTDLKARTRGWTSAYERVAIGEWGYSKAQKTLMIEERLGEAESLTEYKFYVFGGQVKFILINVGRFNSLKSSYYTPQWELMPVSGRDPDAGPIPKPNRLEDMLEFASALGQSFSFVRVDLYETDGVVWFSELTPYPAGGMSRFKPDQFDFEMGEWWRQAQRMEVRRRENLG